ncbi:MAG: quinolinate synthase NadA [Bacillota bacterium]
MEKTLTLELYNPSHQDPQKVKLIQEIADLKKERKAVILAHFYQPPDIQRVADFVGDSLQLAQQAAKTSAEVLVMCGVQFMAESAALLCPDRLVLIPEENAGCPMADMVEPAALRLLKEKIPGALVVCYINSSAAVKAESYICCTSSNAVRVVESLPADVPLIFVPDQNLGKWVQRKTGRKMVLWEGYCPSHHDLSVEAVQQVKDQHPEAEVLVHPECRPEVINLADGVFSTAGIIEYVGKSSNNSFIIGTEQGILYQLQTRYPEKAFYLASPVLLCENMKSIDLFKLKRALQTLTPRVTVPPAVSKAATLALNRMLALG